MWWLLLMLVGCGPEGTDPSGDDDDATVDEPAEDPWFCDSPSLDVSSEGGGVRVTGPHVDLWAATDEARAEELGALLEASIPAMEEWFGQDIPADRLPVTVEVHADEASMLASIKAAGVSKPDDAGGYYHPTPQVSWLFRQPTRYYEQVLLLHEVAHQVQDLTSTSSLGAPGWWTEGVAEYLGRHDWDGDCARVGMRPLGTLEDFDRRALEAVDGGLTFESVLEGGGGRPGFYGAVAWLDEGHDGGMAELIAAMDDGEGALDPAAAVEAAFGTIDGWRGFLQERQQPIEAFYEEWLHRSPTSMIGTSNGVIHGRLKEAPASFSVTVPGPADGMAAGVLAAWEGSDRWSAVLAAEDGIWSFDVDGGAIWNFRAELPTGSPPWVVSTAPVDGGTEVTLGDRVFVLEHGMAYAAGLSVSGGEAEFTELSWE